MDARTRRRPRQSTIPGVLPREQLRKGPRNNEEARHQKALIAWCKIMSKQRPELGMLFAIPNGSYLVSGNIQGRHLKEQGVLSGVPDLFLPIPTHRPQKVKNNTGTEEVTVNVPGYCGCFVELKSKGGRLSEAQREVISHLLTRGYEVIIAKSWTEARDALLHYLDEGKDA